MVILKIMDKTKRGSAEYRAWCAMCTRCYNPNTKDWMNYGGKGITVSERWLNNGVMGRGFSNFFDDMGPRPSENHSLDRIDGDKGYFPENCRWSTRQTQSENRKTVKIYNVKGVSGNITQLCKHFGISKIMASNRIHQYGWSIEDAVSLPKQNRWSRRKSKHQK